jgi:Secreted repeat of unknown function
MPLYGWKNDTKPGDVTGQGINGFSAASRNGGPRNAARGQRRGSAAGVK